MLCCVSCLITEVQYRHFFFLVISEQYNGTRGGFRIALFIRLKKNLRNEERPC